MTEAQWLAESDPRATLPMVRDRASRRKLRLLACGCCRRFWFEMGGPVARQKVARAEMYADGEITETTFLAAFSGETDYTRYTILEQLHRAAQALGWPEVEEHSEFLATPREPREYAERQTDEVLSHLAEAGGLDYLGVCRQRQLPSEEYLTFVDRADRERQAGVTRERAAQAHLVRDIFANPFRSVRFSPEWRTATAIALAQQMYESREFSAMPILADALQDAGCDNDEVLSHCRGAGPHVRGCWVVDLVLGKE
jgi:hypothetical protein